VQVSRGAQLELSAHPNSGGERPRLPKAAMLVQLSLQSAAANWLADILQHTYDDALCVKGIDGGADGVLLNAGMLRGDSTYGPGQYHQASEHGIL